ncbi:basic proline-rich protein-like isoform X3 [Daphnia pulicaria]|uniref:basic proline-rich protein-like isoform X3 n=1 Tax=Daphnia pulicaria TaxID=35523 RepID=UPI001EE9B6DA|nr:basic proline-rich protein-like isoform X3 [Daphnia pulicaria]
MLAMIVWRLVATFLFVNVVCGQGYQPPSDEYIYQQQPLQHYDGYETHRQYRSAGDEPTTITPSVSLKENLSENQTLDSDLGNNSTHINGSITLVTDMPLESSSMASPVPSLLMGRDTSKSVLDSSNLSSIEQLNVTTEKVNSTSDNSTVEEIKILKRRQAQQVLIQQVPTQSQQVPSLVFQPLSFQRSQFIQAPPTLFSGQPGQPALVQVPIGQSQFVPNQLRFVQPQFLVPQIVPLQNSQASITQPPVQSPPKSPPKLSLNPVPLPPAISIPHPNMTTPPSDNDSQANAVKTREANANRMVPKAQQPPMGAFKPMVSPMPPRPTPPPAPVRGSPVAPTTTTPPMQAPMQMMPVSAPVQPMVRPQLQGQQAPPQSQQSVVVQNTTPLPRGLMVPPPLSLEAQNGRPTTAVQLGSFPAPTMISFPPQTVQRTGSPMDLQPQQQQQPQLMGQAPPAQVAQRSGPPMDQQSLPVGQSMNQPPSAAQHSVPPVNQPSPPQPMSQTPANQVAQPPGQRSMGQVQQQTMVQPVGQAPQAQAVQRSGPPMDHPLQQQQQQLPVGQAPPSQVAQRSGSPMDQPQQPMPSGQPMGQAPPSQVAQRSGPPMDQPQMLQPSQSMNQPPPDAQRSGPLMNQPSQQQPTSQPMSQTQVTQQPGPQLMGQANALAVQRSGPPMDHPLQQQQQQLPVGQAPPSQGAQRSGSSMDQTQQPMPASQPMGQAPPTQVAQRSGPPMDQPQMLQPSQSMNQPPPDAQRSGPPTNQPSQPQLMGQPMGQASPAQVGQRTGPLLVNQPLPSTSQQPFGAPNSQPPPPPPPPQPQQQMAQQMMGLNQQPPQSPQIAPRINSPMNPPAPSSMMDFSQSVDATSLPVSQFNQRSVQDGRGGHQMNLVPSNKERHMMRRSVDRPRMRRQMDAVPYPSKEAYDSYVVNNYRNLYDEVYPTYTPPVYTTTTAAAPKYEYYVPRY